MSESEEEETGSSIADRRAGLVCFGLAAATVVCGYSIAPGVEIMAILFLALGLPLYFQLRIGRWLLVGFFVLLFGAMGVGSLWSLYDQGWDWGDAKFAVLALGFTIMVAFGVRKQL